VFFYDQPAFGSGLADGDETIVGPCSACLRCSGGRGWITEDDVPVLGLDLKTGAPWDNNMLNRIQRRFNNIPIIQIRTGP